MCSFSLQDWVTLNVGGFRTLREALHLAPANFTKSLQFSISMRSSFERQTHTVLYAELSYRKVV
jgi:hypothetical protein